LRLALVTEIPAPFRIASWNALAAGASVELRVLLLAERDPRRAYEVEREDWRFDARVLGGADRLVRGRWIVLSRGVRAELERFAPDAIVVGGWNQPAFLQAALFARRRGLPFVVWSESTARDARPRSVARSAVKRWMIGGASGFVVPGTAAAEHLVALGADGQRVMIAPNAVDEPFRHSVARERGRRADLRRELGVEGCCVLCVSRLAREKGVDLLLRAFRGVPAQLVVAGDGPQRDRLAALGGSNVRLLGAVARDELPRWYAAADAFALASRSETWGMALAEAAAAGLPLVASEAAGAGHDLIEDGVNGLRVRTGDEQALRAALERVARDEGFRLRAGTRSRELARDATPARWAQAVATAAGAAAQAVRTPQEGLSSSA
jgi:glycosyltransferase involved in cell wall biosynthesis